MVAKAPKESGEVMLSAPLTAGSQLGLLQCITFRSSKVSCGRGAIGGCDTTAPSIGLDRSHAGERGAADQGPGAVSGQAPFCLERESPYFEVSYLTLKLRL